MHVAPLQVFDDANFDRLSIGEFHDAHRDIFESGQLRRAVAPRPGDDFIGVLVDRPDKQGREYALRADAVCLLWRSPFCDRGRGEPHGNRRLPYVIGT